MPPPPLPPCFPILNPNYFSNLVLSVNGAGTEAELQALVNTVFTDLSILQSNIDSQIALLAPLLAALTAPTGSFGSIISWANSLITVLTQQYKPYLTYPTQLVALASAVATLTTAINAAATAKGFSITIPTVGPVCTL